MLLHLLRLVLLGACLPTAPLTPLMSHAARIVTPIAMLQTKLAIETKGPQLRHQLAALSNVAWDGGIKADQQQLQASAARPQANVNTASAPTVPRFVGVGQEPASPSPVASQSRLPEHQLGLFRRAAVQVYFDAASAGGTCVSGTNTPSPMTENLPKGNVSVQINVARCMNIVGVSNPSITVSVPAGGFMLDAHWHQISPPFGWANPTVQAAIDNFFLEFTVTSATLKFLNNGRGANFVGSLITTYLDPE